MDIKFYPKTVDCRSANSAQITFKGNTLGNERSTFTRISEEGQNIPTFVGKGMQENTVAIKLAQKLVLEKYANVLLICRPYIFKEVVKSSCASLQAHLKYYEQENIIIYYMLIKGQQSILLTAYEEWD